MPHLGRQIRFSVNPFLPRDTEGFNAYTSKPAGEGVALFLQLDVELIGPVQPQTGFVINVVEIDRAARACAVPVFAEQIRTSWRAGRHIDLDAVVRMLSVAWQRLDGQFGAARVDKLALRLNPFRKIAMDEETPRTVCYGEKFEFAAMHKLWNDDFSEQQNFEVFGKCANPTGHGHNYIVEVTVQVPADGAGFQAGAFQQTVETQLIDAIDHKNLNADVPEFEKTIPTIENLAAFAWSRLAGQFTGGTLHSVTVWESDRTYCTVSA
ncbi:MAG: 6-carboxytetrahydropterin synthase [Sedimentisphaerales bacterium]|nr:6-carboxytetrahydropterin synthase [Sedimentisphaerales bacterium]